MLPGDVDGDDDLGDPSFSVLSREGDQLILLSRGIVRAAAEVRKTARAITASLAS